MKFTISLLLLLGLVTCKEIQAQELNISGTWTMYEMIWTTAQGDEKTTEDQLKDEAIHLTRSSPDMGASVVNSFKRK